MSLMLSPDYQVTTPKKRNKQEVKGLNVLVSEVSPILSNVILDMFWKEFANNVLSYHLI